MQYGLLFIALLIAGNAYAQDTSTALTQQLQSQQDTNAREEFMQKREQTHVLQQQQQEQQQQSQMQRQQQNLDNLHYSTDYGHR